MLLHLQNSVSVFFEILIFSRDIHGHIHYVPEINLSSKGTIIKAFCLPRKTIQKKSETLFCRRKTAEGDNANTNVSPNISCTFLPYKVSAFLQVFFLRKSKIWERQFFSIVNVWHPFHINLFICLIKLEHRLNTWREQTLVYLFISLIKAEHPLKTSNKRTHM